MAGEAAGEVADPVTVSRTQGFAASALATEVTEALERLWGKAPGR
jgi:hypothetical protein